MTIDYDVVIIGGSPAGRYAALAATQLKAKVALVESQVNNGLIFHQAFNEIAHRTHNFSYLADFGINTIQSNTAEQCQISLASPEVMLYAQGVVSNIQESNSIANLAAQGIDFIFGNGQFQTSPHLSFAINQRLLRGRTYLLATGSRPKIPAIEGLSATGYRTLANIWQSLYKQGSLISSPPQDWLIIGGIPQSIEIAQTLVRLGCNVTLVIQSPDLLPHIDPEIAQLLQAQLEVDGIRVLTQTVVTQVKRIEHKKWVQAGDRAIEVDEILIAIGQQPNLEVLNLAEAGVKWHQHRLIVNNKLQTTNRRIYACGDVIGGYDFLHIAHYEARIALKNALFVPQFSVDYRCLPWAILSYPNLAQVGLTQAQARRRFARKEIFVLQHYYKSVAAAQLRNATTGICQLVVLNNGEILGATILGAEARELINIIALAMAQKIPVKQLANLSTVYPSFSEILEQTAREWSQQKLNSNPALQDWLEGFFHWRRNWNL
ncbi:NAD(P)/FAD-dependent oxidoreductase [Nostoc sp. TCL26-01]|uniref:dihydrolipoyl dehydrogenase family protein n=1 Tax=Nostoc sp. TCL26-01 TaxID=2576904 RepID=UPI0015BEDC4B|nr:NAD(P)/FAD-dependent oxidoreductase [Nostoc sp. TCL26-01]QLE54218.1 NAD(P)/FAD-dependent oxidoreductase [Nostoc sp. TCL26-01]